MSWFTRLTAGRTSTKRSPNRKTLALETLEQRDVPAVISWMINTTADTNDANLNDGVALDANGQVSLRAAIQQANNDRNADGYQISVQQPPPMPGPLLIPVYTIQLTRAMDPLVAKITITGANADLRAYTGIIYAATQRISAFDASPESRGSLGLNNLFSMMRTCDI